MIILRDKNFSLSFRTSTNFIKENAKEILNNKKGFLRGLFRKSPKTEAEAIELATNELKKQRSAKAAELLKQRAAFFKNNNVKAGEKMSKGVLDKYKNQFVDTGGARSVGRQPMISNGWERDAANIKTRNVGAIDLDSYEHLVNKGILPKGGLSSGTHDAIQLTGGVNTWKSMRGNVYKDPIVENVTNRLKGGNL